MGNAGAAVLSGSPDYSETYWADEGIDPKTEALPLYALSSPITIFAVPEPKTRASLGVLGVMGVLGFVWYRRRHAKPQPAHRHSHGRRHSYYED